MGFVPGRVAGISVIASLYKAQTCCLRKESQQGPERSSRFCLTMAYVCRSYSTPGHCQHQRTGGSRSLCCGGSQSVCPMMGPCSGPAGSHATPATSPSAWSATTSRVCSPCSSPILMWCRPSRQPQSLSRYCLHHLLSTNKGNT